MPKKKNQNKKNNKDEEVASENTVSTEVDNTKPEDSQENQEESGNNVAEQDGNVKITEETKEEEIVPAGENTHINKNDEVIKHEELHQEELKPEVIISLPEVKTEIINELINEPAVTHHDIHSNVAEIKEVEKITLPEENAAEVDDSRVDKKRGSSKKILKKTTIENENNDKINHDIKKEENIVEDIKNVEETLHIPEKSIINVETSHAIEKDLELLSNANHVNEGLTHTELAKEEPILHNVPVSVSVLIANEDVAQVTSPNTHDHSLISGTEHGGESHATPLKEIPSVHHHTESDYLHGVPRPETVTVSPITHTEIKTVENKLPEEKSITIETPTKYQAPKKESSASEKMEKFSNVPNSYSSEDKLRIEQQNSRSEKKTEDIKLIEKIDIDKKDDNLEQIRRNNSRNDDQVPKKDRKGFCTNCVIY